MKLRDLVANSLPRVRGKKKKASAAVTPAASAGATAKSENSSSRSFFDKCEKKFLSNGSRSNSCDKSHEFQGGIAEASWRGNALYRGLEAARAVELNSRMMSTSYSSSRGMVTSHSADEFTPQMTMSRSYDSRLTIQNCSASCSQMWSISESCREPLSSPQQYYHCHYHRHNHHHYLHQHPQSQPMAPVEQNQQKLRLETRDGNYLGSHKSQETTKSEHGFFRKSFASFRGIRKQSKSSKDPKQTGTEQQYACSLCPYPQMTMSSTEKKATEKRSAKPKRKSLRELSKSKENKEKAAFSSEKYDKSWYSDNDAQNVASPVVPRSDPSYSMFPTYERSHFRECSVESCSSRVFGSREGSCVREIDYTGFDSASLSGYESDFPRSKVHRSRSRIKTNPWLPSPQPSLSKPAREFHEDALTSGMPSGRFPRSASFEHQRNVPGLCQNSPMCGSNRSASISHRHRSLTPNDGKRSFSLVAPVTPTSCADKPSWWAGNDQSVDAPRNCGRTSVGTFNDLSTKAHLSRPTSMVSPNSEFVMLADNLEQLANNISFEYEDMLDTTLESVSLFQEDGQASIQELLTDEENGNFETKVTKSEGDAHTAPSPDSGIACLGSTDGDEAMTPCAPTERKSVEMEYLASASPSGSFNNPSRRLSSTGTTQNPAKDTLALSNALKCPHNGTLDSADTFLLTRASRLNVDAEHVQETSLSAKEYMLDEGRPDSASESQTDKVASQGKTVAEVRPDEKASLVKNKELASSKSNTDNVGSIKSTALMVEERLDMQYQPSHRQYQGSGIVMGTGGVIHYYNQQLGNAGKQRACKIMDSNGAGFRVVHRPCALTGNFSAKKVPRRMNDMEKCSSRDQKNRPWSDEFDMPMNIVGTECIESPTENWTCDGQFCMNDGLEVTDLFEMKKQIPATGSNITSEGTVCFIKDTEHAVETNRFANVSGSQSADGEVATSLNECSMDNIENRPLIPAFDLNDACVQTDFNDDFCRWEENDTLERLEEKALDPAESTRIWLLTGNMQDSADTGYSSLTRDSQILMDEDSLILASELEERAASERLSYGDSSFACDFNEKTPRNSVNFDERTPRNSVNFDERIPRNSVSFDEKAPRNSIAPSAGSLSDFPCAQLKNSPSKDTGDIKLGQDGDRLQEFSENVSPSLCCATHASKRAIPLYQVNEMFSNIESHFQEIFEKIYSNNRTCNYEAKRMSSDSSDSTLRSSSSDNVTRRISDSSGMKHSTSNDSETGETTDSLKSRTGKALVANEDHKNVLPSKPLDVARMSKVTPSQNGPGTNLSETNAEMSVGHVKLNPGTPSQCSRPDACPRTEMNKSVSTPGGAAAAAERADYLEFLKDTPLSRSHLKRPLFLVPGVGPLDMTRPEQMNLFAKTGSTSGERPLSCSSASSMSSKSAASPTSAHCGKKQKCKKGEKIFSDLSLSNDWSQVSRAKLPNPSSFSSSQRHPCTVRGSHDQTKAIPSFSSALCSDGRVCTERELRRATSPQKSQAPLPGSETTSFSKSPQATRQLGRKSHSFADRSSSAHHRGKDTGFQKNPDVQKDQASRQQQLMILAQRKAAVLGNLCELRTRLQEESSRLKQKERFSEDI